MLLNEAKCSTDTQRNWWAFCLAFMVEFGVFSGVKNNSNSEGYQFFVIVKQLSYAVFVFNSTRIFVNTIIGLEKNPSQR